MRRKGSSVIGMFLFAFAVFLFMIFFGIAIWSFSLIDDALDQDVDVGQVNLRDVNDDTFGALTQAMLDQADAFALIFILGTVVVMLLNAHLFGDSNKLWIPIDMLILIFVFILSVYFSQVYEIFINADVLLSAIYVDQLPKSSTMLLNLPAIIATIGALLMIVTYVKVNKEEGQTNVLGFG